MKSLKQVIVILSKKRAVRIKKGRILISKQFNSVAERVVGLLQSSFRSSSNIKNPFSQALKKLNEENENQRIEIENEYFCRFDSRIKELCGGMMEGPGKHPNEILRSLGIRESDYFQYRKMLQKAQKSYDENKMVEYMRSHNLIGLA